MKSPPPEKKKTVEKFRELLFFWITSHQNNTYKMTERNFIDTKIFLICKVHLISRMS